jgi:ATP-dependent Clp protease ATP-binding subunit ClpC
MAKRCDICGIRPATVRAQVTTSDGDTQVLDLCEVDYRRLARQQRQSSPLESLFGGRGGLFEDFFGDDFFGSRSSRGPDAETAGADRDADAATYRSAPRNRPVHPTAGEAAVPKSA